MTDGYLSDWLKRASSLHHWDKFPIQRQQPIKEGRCLFLLATPTKCGGEGVLYPPMKCMSWLEVTTVHSQCFPWDWPEKLGRLLDRWPLVFPKEVTSQCWVKQQVKHCAFPTAHDTRRNRNISQHTVNIGTCFFFVNIYIYIKLTVCIKH